MNNIIKIISIVLLILVTTNSQSQIISPTGITSRTSTQLIFYYDGFNEDSIIQLTNTNDTEGVWLHVQIFRSFDTDETPGNGNEVFCDERDFVDFFTPNDTHIYVMDELIIKNVGETETDAGESSSVTGAETKGFVIVTPVVSESDFTAISFQHMSGITANEPAVGAIGRDAVDFATGEFLPDGTPLNGTTNGFVLLQPEELIFEFIDVGSDVDVIGISFVDNYGPAGLLGYTVTPGDISWTSFIFDFKEDPTSCGNREVNCFLTVGLNETIGQSNDELTENDLLCSGAISPEGIGEGIAYGWTRIFVSGIDDFENTVGFFNGISAVLAIPMNTKGERTEIEPPPTEEDCSVEGDEDDDGFADCLDTDCATAEECETGEDECADGMDNDEDGDTDCEDLGCDGFAGCEFGEETSCDDGIDNDADGDTDNADSDCMEETTGGDGGDGGGCTVVKTSTTSTAAVNILILLLPFIGVFGIRRVMKRA